MNRYHYIYGSSNMSFCSNLNLKCLCKKIMFIVYIFFRFFGFIMITTYDELCIKISNPVYKNCAFYFKI